jgi:hypothetical protein
MRLHPSGKAPIESGCERVADRWRTFPAVTADRAWAKLDLAIPIEVVPVSALPRGTLVP